MEQQPSLFDVGERLKNPLCAFEKHCGSIAVLGPRVDWEGGYNESIFCLRCLRFVGERSTRTA